jgi:hypothetical protein
MSIEDNVKKQLQTHHRPPIKTKSIGISILLKFSQHERVSIL